MSLSSDDRLLIAAKLIVNEMDILSQTQQGSQAMYLGMGLALARVYSVLRNIHPKELARIKPIDMMKWVREQPFEEETGKFFGRSIQ